MNRSVLCAGIAALIVFAVAESRAEWPTWNPFASSASAANNVNGNSKSWWSTWGSSSPRQGPTTWQRMQSAPSTMMNKTKQTLAPLNPFRQEQKPTTPAGFMSSSNKKKTPAKSASWFKWSSEKEEQGPPLTVSDWLDAPRPQ